MTLNMEDQELILHTGGGGGGGGDALFPPEFTMPPLSKLAAVFRYFFIFAHEEDTCVAMGLTESCK